MEVCVQKHFDCNIKTTCLCNVFVIISDLLFPIMGVCGGKKSIQELQPSFESIHKC